MSGEGYDWLERPEPGWTPVDLPYPAAAASYVSGDTDGDRLHVAFHRSDADGALMTKVIFGAGTQGPPGHAHGGSMAALLDEAMGGVAWLAGHPVVAVELNVSFREMLPLGSRCVVESSIIDKKGRKIRAASELRSPDGDVVYCTGSALLIELSADQVDDIARFIKR